MQGLLLKFMSTGIIRLFSSLPEKYQIELGEQLVMKTPIAFLSLLLVIRINEIESMSVFIQPGSGLVQKVRFSMCLT